MILQVQYIFQQFFIFFSHLKNNTTYNVLSQQKFKAVTFIVNPDKYF